MIKGVNLSPSEQLSLIIEHTTNESKRLVQRLRNAFIENPGEGLKQVWCKLGERFGSNAVVTQVHLAKLNSFPKIGFRDNKRLQEFGDLLLELQCAKNDGGLKGLKILDEPAYLRPVAAKLPEDLQGRWQRHAIDLFSLYILFSHFRPRDATRGNSFFQMSSYARANLRITNEKTKGKFP